MCSTRGKPRWWLLPVFWPWAWAGVLTTAFMSAGAAPAGRNSPRWRTPLLSEHVRRLKLNPPEMRRQPKRKHARAWIS